MASVPRVYGACCGYHDGQRESGSAVATVSLPSSVYGAARTLKWGGCWPSCVVVDRRGLSLWRAGPSGHPANGRS